MRESELAGLVEELGKFGLSPQEAREVIRLVADWTGGNLPDNWKSGERVRRTAEVKNTVKRHLKVE